MYEKSMLLILLLLSVLFTSCETKAGTGALAGGAVGVGAGALIGGGPGALIGGAVGAVGGSIIGASLDTQDRRAIQQNNPKTMKRIDNGEQLSIEDIITLHKAGISDEKIMDLIDKTQSSYRLTTNTVKKLEQEGISDRVINHMMDT